MPDFHLQPLPHPSRRNCWEAIRSAPDGYIVQIKPPTRSLEQNAKLWAMLAEVSAQVEWYGYRLTPEEWKDVFSAALHRSKVVPGLDGGFVVCGQSTSRMSIKEMNDMIESIYAFGSDSKHPVDFKDVVNLEPVGRVHG